MFHVLLISRWLGCAHFAFVRAQMQSTLAFVSSQMQNNVAFVRAPMPNNPAFVRAKMQNNHAINNLKMLSLANVIGWLRSAFGYCLKNLD